MKIRAIPTTGRQLKPGDLFSVAGPEYWDLIMPMKGSCGECVYVRTNTPPDDFPDADELIFRIVIEEK